MTSSTKLGSSRYGSPASIRRDRKAMERVIRSFLRFGHLMAPVQH
jgi:hypothetical protein